MGFAATVAAIAIATRTTVAAAAATTSATTIAAATTAATRTTVAARFARRTSVFHFFAGFLIDDTHRQADLATLIDLEDLDLNFLAFGHDVGRLLDTFVLHFADMDEYRHDPQYGQQDRDSDP